MSHTELQSHVEVVSFLQPKAVEAALMTPGQATGGLLLAAFIVVCLCANPYQMNLSYYKEEMLGGSRWVIGKPFAPGSVPTLA